MADLESGDQDIWFRKRALNKQSKQGPCGQRYCQLMQYGRARVVDER